MVHKAWPFPPADRFSDVLLALTNREMLTHSGNGFPQGIAAQIRTKVFCSILPKPAHYFDPGVILLIVYPHIRKMLVVLQEYVIVWLVLLD